MPDTNQKQDQSIQSSAEQAAGPITLNELLKVVLTDPNLDSAPEKLLITELCVNSPTSDRWTFRSAMWILGAVVIITVIALSVLTYYKFTAPEGLVAIGSGAAGGLAGLLTPNPKENHNQ